MSLEIKGRVPRGRNMEIRVQVGKGWKDTDVVDIRWFKERTSIASDGMTNVSMGPTVKGLRMNMEEAKHIYDIMERIMNEEKYKRKSINGNNEDD